MLKAMPLLRPRRKPGIANFETDMYSDVFPTGVRYIPVVDAPTDMDRQGKVAFELREIGEDEIVRTEETDVLVAGCGITGVCAALSASDDGTTQVLCLEKMSEGRGMFEGMGVTGGAAMAAADYVCDKPLMMDRMRHAAYYRVPIDPIKLWGRSLAGGGRLAAGEVRRGRRPDHRGL